MTQQAAKSATMKRSNNESAAPFVSEAITCVEKLNSEAEA